MSSLSKTFDLWQDAQTLSLVKRLIQSYAKPYLKILLLGVFFMMLVALATALLARQMQPVIDDVFFNKETSKLYGVALQVFVIFSVKGFASYGESVVMGYVGQKIIADIELDLFKKVIRADFGFLQKTHSGNLVARFITDVPMLEGAVTNTLTSIVKDVLTVLFLVAVMFYQDWLLSCFAIFIFPMAILPISRIGKKMRRTSLDILTGWGFFTTLVTQAIQGVRLIKAYALEEHESMRAQKTIEANLKLTLRGIRIKSAVHPLMEMLGGVAIIIVIIYGGGRVIQGTESAGAFFSFITALIMAYEPLKSLAKLNNTLQESLAALTRILKIVDKKQDIVEIRDPKVLSVSEGRIEFRNVSFEYRPGVKVLREINLVLRPGEKIALVGPSGAGKSTLLNLIPRFYDPTEGTLLIDGQNIAHVTFNSLRSSMALVSQEVILFDDTVRNNILLGDLNATEAAVREAAEAAAAHAFIQDLPEGYETSTGEQGVKLSGGQRQRLSIARAMLRNAPILLLDEATSALDSESEKRIQEALNQLRKGRTSITIAHRLSTVMDADMICVMDEGRIVATGSHDYLLKNNALYQKLCKAQLSDGKTV